MAHKIHCYACSIVIFLFAAILLNTSCHHNWSQYGPASLKSLYEAKNKEQAREIDENTFQPAESNGHMNAAFKWLFLSADKTYSSSASDMAYHDKKNNSQKISSNSPLSLDRQIKSLALAAGSQELSGTIEQFLSSYGKARISFFLNSDGHFNGYGDFLYSLYDSDITTVFMQFGGRSMDNDRFIMNLGFGQRFFYDEVWAVGYNAFYDYDISRYHSRAGFGGEIWYDWLRLSANAYFPVSGWRSSDDLHGVKDFYQPEERAARGWDVKLKGYVPSYRHIALTGAYTSWKGDHVALFGNDDLLKSDPKIWSYGLEYTPFPLVSASFNRSASGSEHDTDFNIGLTWHFGLSLDEHLSSSAVEQMRSISGSRHDFVDRENKMILEYRERAKFSFWSAGIHNLTSSSLAVGEPLSFNVQLLYDGLPSTAGVAVEWSVDQGGVLSPYTETGKKTFSGATARASSSSSFTAYTDDNGFTEVVLTPTSNGIITLTVSAKGNSISRQLNINSDYTLQLIASSSAVVNKSTAVEAIFTNGGKPQPGVEIVWSIIEGDSNAVLNLSPLSSPTDAKGRVQAKLKSSIAQDVVLEVEAKGSGGVVMAKATRRINIRDQYVLASSGLHNSGVGEDVEITALLLDGGVAAKGMVLKWNQDDGPANGLTFLNTSGVTDNNGEVKFKTSGIAEGVYTIKIEAFDAANAVVDYTYFMLMVLNGDIYRITMDGPNTANVNKSFTVTATLTDNNVAVAGATLDWTISKGSQGSTIISQSGLTDSNGAGSITLQSSITNNIAVTVKALDNTSKVLAAASYQVLVENGYNLFLNGPDTANITVQPTLTLVVDNGGIPVVGENVSWSSSTAGTSIITNSSSGQTDSDGTATVTVAQSVLGNAVIRATLTDNPSNYVEKTITFTGGEDGIHIQSISKDIIASNGQSIIKALVTQGGVPVPAGHVVVWSLEGKVIDTTGAFMVIPSSLGETATDANGIATLIYAPALSTGQAGGVRVKASLKTNPLKFDKAILAVGFSTPIPLSGGWNSACIQCGGSGDLTQGPGGGDPDDAYYQASTNLPTLEQLRTIEAANRPLGWPLNDWLTYIYWAGVAHGNPDPSLAATVELDHTDSRAWNDASTTGYGVVCLK